MFESNLSTTVGTKVRKTARIRNRYNQVPHLSQDTKWESNKITINISNKSQEVSPFPSGDYKAAMNRRESLTLTSWLYFCLVLLCFHARLFVDALWSPAGKGLTSWLSFLMFIVTLSLSHWYPGSGVVLDCIDS